VVSVVRKPRRLQPLCKEAREETTERNHSPAPATDATAPLKITAIVVVHNEEKFVRQCLSSLAAVADELLVAHDGPCRDRSLEFAREFTPNVFEHEWRGACEPNLIRLLHRASNDWIVRLDADETFSPTLIKALRDVKARGGDEGVTQYMGIWRAVYKLDDESPARPHERSNRIVLFRKSCTQWIGIPHNTRRISGGVKELNECVYHYAPYQQYGVYELITKKMIPFARVDAALRVKYPIELIGYAGKTIEEVLRPVDRWRSERPLLVGPPLAALSYARALRNVFRAGTATEFAHNMRWPFVHASYQLLLAWQIHRLRREGFAPRLAP
jgi:glycosyltransferase involved in cell wall biosynthesis